MSKNSHRATRWGWKWRPTDYESGQTLSMECDVMIFQPPGQAVHPPGTWQAISSIAVGCQAGCQTGKRDRSRLGASLTLGLSCSDGLSGALLALSRRHILGCLLAPKRASLFAALRPLLLEERQNGLWQLHLRRSRLHVSSTILHSL